MVFSKLYGMAVGSGTHGQVISEITIGNDGFHVGTGGGNNLQVDCNKGFFL